MKINQLKTWKPNPREITPERLQALRDSMFEFGDLSGIVFNRTNESLVCGHQRVSCLLGEAEIEPTEDPDQGWISGPNGERFSVRFVDWEETKHAAAAIAANSVEMQGDWKQDELDELLATIGRDDQEIFKQLRLGELSPDVSELLAREQNQVASIADLTEGEIAASEKIAELESDGDDAEETDSEVNKIYQVVAKCDGEKMQEEIYNLLKSRGFEAKVQTLF